MDSLVQEVVIRTLIAVGVGFILGWALKQILYGNRLEKANSMWRGRLNLAEDERDELQERITLVNNELTATDANWSKKYASLSKERDTLSERVDELAVRERDLETSWQQRVTEVEKERNELNAQIQELTVTADRVGELERERDSFKAKVRELTNHLTTAETAWRERAESAERERDKLAAEVQRTTAESSSSGVSVRVAELQRERDLYSARVSELTSRLSMLERERGAEAPGTPMPPSTDNGANAGSARGTSPAGGVFGSPPPLPGAADDPLDRNSYKVEDVEGVGEVYGRRLRAANIVTTDDLVKRCCDAAGRREVARETGFGESLLLKWANIADLMRVPGVGSESAALLEAAGVDTVNELRHRSAENLAAKMSEVNTVRRLARQAPDARTVAKWIENSREVPPAVSI